MVGGLGVVIAGCTEQGRPLLVRPGAPWPSAPVRLQTVTETAYLPPLQAPIRRVAALQVLPRQMWAKGAPIRRRLNPMHAIKQITVHHEGWDKVTFTDLATTARRLEAIRKSHLKRLGAGDIGYHFIIDRAGNLWEGRKESYQGAHVRNHNPHNLGVMVLGNFDEQEPADIQYVALRDTLFKLMHRYAIGPRHIYTHQELMPTACPGWHLQHHMLDLRPRLSA